MIIQNGKTIHLQGRDISYVMFEHEHGDLLHFYFGKKLGDSDFSTFMSEWSDYDSDMYLDNLPQEYPSCGHSDLRMPAYEVENQYGNCISQLKVEEFIVHKGETAQVDGMPYLMKGDKNADTLEAVLSDKTIGLEVRLFYTVFDEYNIIARNAVIINRSDKPMKLTRAYSASFDVYKDDYELITLPGLWANERNLVKTPLMWGNIVEAENGRESSHQLNPFAMLAKKGCNEEYGEVYGLSLIYSGNHSTAAKCEQREEIRIMQGINPHGFEKVLSPGESFCTPQCVLCYSDEGFGKLSHEYHNLYMNNLMRSKFVHEDRPILINNWEGTYFDFNEDRLLAIAKKAKEAGAELFVLDDGWFGKRDNDDCSLGDWVVNEKKLPSGIKGLAEKINELGMKFGLWFEPEMISPDSDLYRAHPDWAIQVPQRKPVLGRNQLILDLTRDEVCEYVIEAVCSVLRDANIEYVKWDFNRPMADMPRPGFNHDYVLGFYKVMGAITEAFPNVLFEGCCGGGGRFDPGVLAYMPQIWTSDNSDAVARMKIQYGTSMCYPVSSMGCHVTAVPNHQNGRVTSLKTRAETAYMGTFGYELDITKSSDEEFEQIKSQIEFDKKIRALVREGDFYRLQNPFEGNFCSWEVAAKDKSRAILYAAKILAVAGSSRNVETVKLKGLDPEKQYREVQSGEVFDGAYLMNRGKRINYDMHDFATVIMEFEEI
ncbi:MAG: alpha-galactosidase [Clostridiales bacterium]|nr:alpha-galactosidase [Clostridiales bacterium]